MIFSTLGPHKNASTFLTVDTDTHPILLDFSAFGSSPIPESKPQNLVPGIEETPTDILQSIFSHVISMDDDDPDLIDLRRSQATVLSCSQVCRTWRASALAQKELWASIVDFQGQSVSRLGHLLEISAPYPLRVGHRSAPISFSSAKTDPRSRDIRDLLRLLQDHEARIRYLHVDWTSYKGAFVVNGQVVSISQLRMPRLEVLVWYGGGPWTLGESWYSQTEADNPYSPAFPLCAELPCLRTVALHYSVAISDPLLLQCRTTLRDLTLSSPCLRSRLTLKQLVGALEGLKNLEFLTLFDVLKTEQGAPTGVSHSLPPISLPRLVHMSFGGSKPDRMDELLPLLGAISPADNCGVQLQLPYRLPYLDHFRQPLLQMLLNLFQSSTPVPTPNSHNPEMRVYLTLETKEKFKCTFSNIYSCAPDDLDFERHGRKSTHRLLASAKSRPLTVSGGCVAHALYCMSPISTQVSSLEVGAVSCVESPFGDDLTFFSTYRAFPNVTSLVLGDGVAEQALQFLTASKGAQEPHLVSLMRVVLKRCKCTPETNLFQILAETLSTRQGVGFPIEELCFDQCVVLKDDIMDISHLFGCEVTIVPGHLTLSQQIQYEKYCTRHDLV